MNRERILTLTGALSAIAITTAMDANGLSAFSALPLFPLMGLFWYLQRFSRKEMGFKWGGGSGYLIAASYPAAVVGAIALVALLSGAIHLQAGKGAKSALNILLISLTTTAVVIITEEGFFRGWLWASLSRLGIDERKTLVITSVVFMLWHLSAVLLPTGFDPPRAQVPVFLVNATLLGLIWGMMRLRSGSVVVSSLSHGIWNGVVYVLFGFGKRVGYLGISDTTVYGPELGWLGVVFNLLFAVVLWRWIVATRK